MSFYDDYDPFRGMDMGKAMASVGHVNVERAMAVDSPGVMDFLALLSPAAVPYLEAMAELAHGKTIRHFGRTMGLYTPLYLSDYCENGCTYCSFSARNRFARKKLSPEDVVREALSISSTGLRHLLILTGESRRESPVDYICDCVRILKPYFHSLSIEIYPLTEAEYADLIGAGVDGLTIYQETYQEAVYREIHPVGPKKDYRFRLDAPERGARSGMRQVSIGALLGLTDWRENILALGLHARYLMDRFPNVEIGASVPRLRPHTGSFAGSSPVTDRDLVQVILALRLFLPHLGISLSTREEPGFRENLIPLGITRMSAGSVTSVGGHAAEPHRGDALPQFEIADHRSVEEMAAMIRSKGYDPVLSDWFSHDL